MVLLGQEEGAKPVAGATVTARGSFDERTATTNEAGAFRFDDLPPGAASLHAQKSGLKPADGAAMVVAGENAGADQLLPEEDQHATLKGQVRDREGRPVSAVLGLSPDGRRVVTDASGRSSFGSSPGFSRWSFAPRAISPSARRCSSRRARRSSSTSTLWRTLPTMTKPLLLALCGAACLLACGEKPAEVLHPPKAPAVVPRPTLAVPAAVKGEVGRIPKAGAKVAGRAGDGLSEGDAVETSAGASATVQLPGRSVEAG